MCLGSHGGAHNERTLSHVKLMTSLICNTWSHTTDTAPERVQFWHENIHL